MTRHQEGWWSEISLALANNGAGFSREPDDLATVQGFLRSCVPVSFEHKDKQGETVRLTLDELADRLAAIERERAASELRGQEARAAARLRLGERKLPEAYSAPDAESVVEEGAWSGFSRADATAWCWNLLQFEPHGFVHPGSQVRAEALRELESGGLPAVFGYPGRAREHVASGLTPRSYREHRIALGSPTFPPADGVFG